jgi:predicted amidophosphoribosyltransferase
MGDALANELIEMYQAKGWIINLVLPVPLGFSRKKGQGYNQAALLAKPLAIATGLPYNPLALSSIKKKQSQVDL